MVLMRTKRLGARWCVVLPIVFAIGCGNNVPNAVANRGAAAEVATSSGPAKGGLPAMGVVDAYRTLEAAQSAIPRQGFDPTAVASMIGNDPVKIFDWVRDHTQWVPYRGALRGPTGVLMDGLGNSLDRSLLLAELLRLAGHDVRLVRGTMDPRVAKDMLARVRTEPAPAANPGGTSRPDQETQQLVSRMQLDGNRVETTLQELKNSHLKNVARTKERIDQEVPSLVKSIGEPQGASEETRLEEHWWVQRRSGSQWEDLDVWSADARPGPALLHPSEFFAVNKANGHVDLGAQNRHELTIRVVAEQWKGGKIARHTILQHTMFPADLAGQTVLLSHVPIPMPAPGNFNRSQDPTGAFRDMAMSITEWLPVLQVGHDQVFQSSVDIHGEPNPSPKLGAKSSSPAPPKGFSVGLDALGGGGETPGDDATFTGEWIEYEIHAPGAKPQVVRRDVFDLLLPAERSGQTAPAEDDARRLTRSLSLLGSTQILAQTSRLSPDFVLQQAMAETLANREALVALNKALRSGVGVVSLDAKQAFRHTSEHLHELALARFAWSPVGADVYIASPNVLTYHRTLRQNSDGTLIAREGFDIVANAIRLRPETRKPSFTTQLTQGTADTNVEALLLNDSTFNAGAALASQVQPQLLTLRSAQDLTRLGQTWLEAARTQISDALQAGYAVVVSNTQDGPNAAHTWWRIDPRTGETLGMGPDGWGQGMVEQAVTAAVAVELGSVAVSMIVTVFTYQLCKVVTTLKSGKDLSPEEDRHCVCEAIDTGINAGGVAGGIVSGGVGIAVPWVGFIAGAAVASMWVLMQIIKAATCAN